MYSTVEACLSPGLVQITLVSHHLWFPFVCVSLLYQLSFPGSSATGLSSALFLTGAPFAPAATGGGPAVVLPPTWLPSSSLRMLQGLAAFPSASDTGLLSASEALGVVGLLYFTSPFSCLPTTPASRRRSRRRRSRMNDMIPAIISKPITVIPTARAILAPGAKPPDPELEPGSELDPESEPESLLPPFEGAVPVSLGED